MLYQNIQIRMMIYDTGSRTVDTLKEQKSDKQDVL